MENKQIFSSESSWKTNNGTFQMMDVLLAILHPFQQYMYQDDGPVIMKGCVQWNPVYRREDFASSQA